MFPGSAGDVPESTLSLEKSHIGASHPKTGRERPVHKNTKKEQQIIREQDTTISHESLEIEEYGLSVMDTAWKTGLTYSDDMEHIVDISEEFLHTMEPIRRMYNTAMSLTTAKLEIMKDEFQYQKKRCPIHHIDTRLKSAGSILGKLQKSDLDLTLTAACNNIFDIAGVRVVCPYMKDVYLIQERIMAQDDIMVMKIKDYIVSPKKNGYRSLHMIIRVPVYFMGKKQLVPVEIQIRTLAMDLWASLEHDIKYKSLYQEKEAGGEDFSQELLECSQLIYQAEEKMQKMNDKLEK